jgi:nucleotide-binding universal stress UspA family protein
MGAVVLGYVASPEGEAALTRAIAEAKLRADRLVVVSSARGGSSMDTDTAIELRTELREVREAIEAAGVAFEIRNLVRGNEPAEDIIDIATEEEAELIVIGLRRRTPVGKLIMGSQAQRIILDSPCAVLAVKAES